MKIAVGNSRMDKKWKNQDISWADLCARCGSTIRTTETVEEYRKLKKGQQDGIKDVGGFVGGHLREGRRKNGMVLCRSLLTLDMDYGTPDIWDEITLFHDFKCCVYSTHKHTPEHPRLRLLIPLKREISEEEYPAVARMVAKEIGIDLFDDTTYEASRLMYWPSTSANGEFFYKVQDGAELDPDEYLSHYDDWHDASTWPVSSRQSEVVQHSIAQQADPLTKPGVVGAFCRAYTVEEAIDTFLSEVYAPSAMNGRYDYIPADSSAGVIVYDGKFAYSHHATDPVCGRLLNAFDLVRLHRFRDLDDKCAPDTAPSKLPSFQAMSDFALKDEKVKVVFAEERKAQANEEFSDEDWQKALELDKAGKVKNTLQNLTVILMNDPLLKPLVFNQLLDGMEIKGDVPWRHPSKFWRDADDAQLISYVDSHYGTFSARNYDIAVAKVTDDRSYHPIREFIEKLQGYWILEIGELAGLKKAEVETLRSFLSRQNDIYRAAFGKRATPHLRQCVFFGTTNAESGYLRDTTGNRRFWPVKTPGTGIKHSWDLTPELICQIWAETLVYVKQGEKLYLSAELEALSKAEQREAMESDEREGLVRLYLDTLLPEDWDGMDIFERRNFLTGSDFGDAQKHGTVKRTQVSNMEIWCECFGKERANIRRTDSNELTAILARLGWKRLDSKVRIPLYGPQYVFVPKECS